MAPARTFDNTRICDV